jgi:hypothetical protein
MFKRRPLFALPVAIGLALAPTAVASAAPHTTDLAPIAASHTDAAEKDTSFPWDGGTAPLGTWQAGDDRPHVARVYLSYDVAAFADARVVDAALTVPESAGDCATHAVELWQTRAADRPTWKDVPERLRPLGTHTACSTPRFDVSDVVQEALRQGEPRISLELAVPKDVEHEAAYGRTLHASKPALTVRHNRTPSIVEFRNAGLSCTTTAPYRSLHGWFDVLSVGTADPDPADTARTVDFALWPQDDPSARTERTGVTVDAAGNASTSITSVPFTHGRTYSWQARVTDGADTSPWSSPCHFAVDTVRPPKPTVSSPNYPQHDWAPVGEQAVFVFDGGGNPDVAGFEYGFDRDSWYSSCRTVDNVFRCTEPFSTRGSVRADAPGGRAQVLINPPQLGYTRFYVWSVDATGMRSEPVEYVFYVWDGQPTVTVVGAEPRYGDPITVRFQADPRAAGTVDFVYSLDGGITEQVVAAAADGTATITFSAIGRSYAQVEARSRSANGWVSPPGSWLWWYLTAPGVTSDVYIGGEPSGGVGVPGTFTFTAPRAWFRTTKFWYTFDGFENFEVPVGPDGTATITWTPTESGPQFIQVTAVDEWNNGQGYAEHQFVVA